MPAPRRASQSAFAAMVDVDDADGLLAAWRGQGPPIIHDREGKDDLFLRALLIGSFRCALALFPLRRPAHRGAGGHTALALAMATKNMEWVERLLPGPQGPAPSPEDALLAARVAVDLDFKEAASALFKALPMPTPQQLCDLLFRAAKRGCRACLPLLAPPRGSAVTFGGGCPGLEAARLGHSELYRLLLGQGLALPQPKGIPTALMAAAAEGRHDFIRGTLDLFDPEARDARGWRALDHAVAQGHLERAKLLIPSTEPIAPAALKMCSQLASRIWIEIDHVGTLALARSENERVALARRAGLELVSDRPPPAPKSFARL